MYYTYILHNTLIDKYYIGYTSNLSARIEEHRKGAHKSKFTRKQLGEWKLVFHEEYGSKSDAIRQEKGIKRWKSKKRIVILIEQSPRIVII